jgi:hypothetical protein
VLRVAARGFLAVLLVAVMTGSAVAFALGVRFSPSVQVCTPTGIPGYGPICRNVPKHNLHHIHIKGFGQIRNCHGHVRLTLTNSNGIPSQVKLVLRIRTTSGKIVRITKTFTLGVGKKRTLNNPLKGYNVLGAQLKLTVTDANGDVATLTKSTRGSRVACVLAASAHRSPAFTG